MVQVRCVWVGGWVWMCVCVVVVGGGGCSSSARRVCSPVGAMWEHACMPACLHACMPACRPTCLPALGAWQRACAVRMHELFCMKARPASVPPHPPHQMRRYYVDEERWEAKKMDVLVEPPAVLDLEPLRVPGGPQASTWAGRGEQRRGRRQHASSGCCRPSAGGSSRGSPCCAAPAAACLPAGPCKLPTSSSPARPAPAPVSPCSLASSCSLRTPLEAPPLLPAAAPPQRLRRLRRSRTRRSWLSWCRWASLRTDPSGQRWRWVAQLLHFDAPLPCRRRCCCCCATNTRPLPAVSDPMPVSRQGFALAPCRTLALCSPVQQLESAEAAAKRAFACEQACSLASSGFLSFCLRRWATRARRLPQSGCLLTWRMQTSTGPRLVRPQTGRFPVHRILSAIGRAGC